MFTKNLVSEYFPLAAHHYLRANPPVERAREEEAAATVARRPGGKADSLAPGG